VTKVATVSDKRLLPANIFRVVVRNYRALLALGVLEASGLDAYVQASNLGK
jgi:hypothetical protein